VAGDLPGHGPDPGTVGNPALGEVIQLLAKVVRGRIEDNKDRITFGRDKGIERPAGDAAQLGRERLQGIVQTAVEFAGRP
jgi:hypothetical protein